MVRTRGCGDHRTERAWSALIESEKMMKLECGDERMLYSAIKMATSSAVKTEATEGSATAASKRSEYAAEPTPSADLEPSVYMGWKPS
jgi:hypothetical protein